MRREEQAHPHIRCEFKNNTIISECDSYHFGDKWGCNSLGQEIFPVEQCKEWMFLQLHLDTQICQPICGLCGCECHLSFARAHLPHHGCSLGVWSSPFPTVLLTVNRRPGTPHCGASEEREVSSQTSQLCYGYKKEAERENETKVEKMPRKETMLISLISVQSQVCLFVTHTHTHQSKEHLKKHSAHAPPVHCWTVWVTLEHFWSKVLRGPTKRLHCPTYGHTLFTKPKVSQNDMTLTVQQDVLWFEVSGEERDGTKQLLNLWVCINIHISHFSRVNISRLYCTKKFNFLQWLLIMWVCAYIPVDNVKRVEVT